MEDYYTIKEVVKLYNININTLYKRIKQGKIPVLNKQVKGKIVKCIKKIDVERFLTSSFYDNKMENMENVKNEEVKYNTITPEFILQIKEDSYKIGKMETENQFLRERLEVLYNDNKQLQEQIKALPDKTLFEKLQGETEVKNSKIQEQEKALEDLTATLQEKEKVIKELYEAHEREVLQSEQREQAIINECRGQLQEYINRPWWKKLW